MSPVSVVSRGWLGASLWGCLVDRSYRQSLSDWEGITSSSSRQFIDIKFHVEQPPALAWPHIFRSFVLRSYAACCYCRIPLDGQVWMECHSLIPCLRDALSDVQSCSYSDGSTALGTKRTPLSWDAAQQPLAGWCLHSIHLLPAKAPAAGL